MTPYGRDTAIQFIASNAINAGDEVVGAADGKIASGVGTLKYVCISNRVVAGSAFLAMPIR